MIPSTLGWYWHRLRRMSATEVVLRGRDQARRQAWRRHQVRPGEQAAASIRGAGRRFPVVLPPGAASAGPDAARSSLVDAADRLLEGRWELLGVERGDMVSPDWFLDPISGRRAPQDRYCFRINHRSEEQTGNVKQVWELSRHHHLTVAAAAWWVSGDDRYAELVDRHLRDWWRQNPFLSGVHWTSGIELGIRLISWTWVRRLLDGWVGVVDLFDGNDVAAQQIRWHQQYLDGFRSAGSSANNHVIAESAGQLVASCAFPWFPESARWRTRAASLLERELDRNTFPSGVNRELASDYHCLVTELGVVAAVEAAAAGHPLGAGTWDRLCRMVDAAAAMVDERVRPPRQGDGDDGRTLVVDAAGHNPWPSLLAAGAGLFGPMPWWPEEGQRPADVRATVLVALGLAPRTPPVERPLSRPSQFADAGMTLLRVSGVDAPEIWCRCDSGPHGYLAIAAHAHADALSVEVRHGGVDVLADPGTYAYHGEQEWRAYFRSTIAHNTVELDGQAQSVSGGPFLWVDHAESRLLEAPDSEDERLARWSAEHYGYQRLDPPAVHRRTVMLDRLERRLTVLDRIECEGRHRCRLSFHLGPLVRASLAGSAASLEWPEADNGGRTSSGKLSLPPGLQWTAHRAETNPVLGWYSPAFGRKEPAVSLVGTGVWGSEDGDLETTLQFAG